MKVQDYSPKGALVAMATDVRASRSVRIWRSSSADRPLAAAGGTPIRWVVAEPDAAAAIRSLFGQNGISGIDVVVR